MQNLLELKTTQTGAVLRISSACLGQGKMPELREVTGFLEASGIRFGVDIAALETALAGKIVDTDIPAAKPKPPVNGRDAGPRILIVPDGKGKPRVMSDDKVDYRDIQTVAQVKVGDVLAVLEPAGEGVPGTDIFGIAIPAVRGKDAKLTAGPNAKLSEDGRTLTAVAAGCLVRKGDIIGVETTFVVEKSVDFNTGNLLFTGDIHVKGDVAEGFTVEGSGNVTVEGDVDGAILVSTGGNVTVKGGLFGRNKARIQAKGDARIAFAQQCRIECRNLVVEKALQDCEVKAYGVDASAPGCQVFGSRIHSFGSVLLAEAGADGNRTEITILDEQEEEFRKEKSKLEAEEAKLSPQIEALDRKLRTQKALIAKAGTVRIPPKIAEEMKATVEAFQQVRRTLTNVQSEKLQLDQEINRPRERNYVLRIAGMVTGSVNLDLFHIRKLLNPGDSGKEFLVSPDKGLISRDAR